MMRKFVFGFAAIVLTLITSACGTSPRVAFYTMEPGAKFVAPPSEAAPAVLVGPVSLPAVVDRPQLVMRAGANRVDILEAHRWGEPLKSAIPRLLAQNMGLLLGSSRVSSYQQYSGADPDYRVLVDIIQFDSTPGEAVIIDANWAIRRSARGTRRSGHSLVRERIAGAGYYAIVAAYSRALVSLSSDLARAIRTEEAAL